METLRQATPLLSKGRNPAVVFIGSIAGIEALGAPIAYGAAKAALTHAMKSAARLLAPNGIRVNMVAPGNIFSPGGTWDKKLGENKRAVEAMLASQVPMRRLGGIEEVVAPVLFLASSKSSFVTGTCLVVDGGQTRS
jgi:3-oxoacyl-[acyl-carrier protein] reductase